jgi:DNA-binding NtrC family response regulator
MENLDKLVQEIGFRGAIQELEREILERAIHEFDWNKSKCARYLQMHRTTLVMKLKTLKINRDKTA